MNPIGKKLLSAAILAACVSGVSAQPGTAFEDGDLILGFQVTSGDGNEKNVFFNLGSPIDYRDGTNQASLGNINATLSLIYGNDWFDRAELRFGAIGNRSHLAPGFGAPGPVNGDPTATLYVSQPATNPGQGTVLSVGTSTALADAGGRVTGMENAIFELDLESDGAAILDQNEHLPIQWQNGWSINNPASPAPSFGVFSNIEQHFGQGGAAVHVDIQRILAASTGANPSGPVRQGEYVVTISIDSAGNITASKAGGPPAGNFTSWAETNNVTGGPDGDSDSDGIPNLLEYALDLNPHGSDESPGTFSGSVVSFAKRAEAVANGDVSYVIETSDDLGIEDPWAPVAATDTPGEISYALPPGKPKSFVRLKVTPIAE